MLGAAQDRSYASLETALGISLPTQLAEKKTRALEELEHCYSFLEPLRAAMPEAKYEGMSIRELVHQAANNDIAPVDVAACPSLREKLDRLVREAVITLPENIAALS